MKLSHRALNSAARLANALTLPKIIGIPYWGPDDKGILLFGGPDFWVPHFRKLPCGVEDDRGLGQVHG